MWRGFRKNFRGGPAERNPPDPKKWRGSTAPVASTSGALVIDFPTPMNYTLLQRMIQVSGRGRCHWSGKAGNLSSPSEELSGVSRRNSRGRAGEFRLVVDTAIEDLAGNHIGQPFDDDTFERVTEHITSKNSIIALCGSLEASRTRIPLPDNALSTAALIYQL